MSYNVRRNDASVFADAPRAISDVLIAKSVTEIGTAQCRKGGGGADNQSRNFTHSV